MNVTGRSLESMLDRRIVWTQTILNGNLQNGVQQLLNENLINPTNADRKIDNFIFLASEDERVTSLTLEAQYTGDNLLTVINSICETNDIGFKVYLNDENKFVFTLYKGQDRSYDQLVNPYVIFSTNFDNIIDSEYLESKTKYKNVTLVAGEDKGTARKTVVVGEGYGIDRRELYTDARDISTTNGNTSLTDAQYTSQLQQRGKENLAKNILIKTFDGEFETQKMFSYRKDFNMGDIVQVVSEYGRETRSQIMEMIISQDLSGYTTYPTFKILDNETGEESEVS